MSAWIVHIGDKLKMVDSCLDVGDKWMLMITTARSATNISKLSSTDFVTYIDVAR